MNNRQTIRLNESQFNKLVSKTVNESVKKILKEELDYKKEKDIANKMISVLSEEEKVFMLEKLNSNSYQDFLYTLMNAINNNGIW